ncbi:MAG: DUF3365 domain-containing protein [Polyangiaceae bacterium]
MRWFFIGMIAALTATGCASKEKKAPPPTDAETTTRAQAALTPFKKSLKEALVSELAKSPVSAIAVCADKAPALAREASKGGVRVGRSSARLRNPDNKPPSWLVPVMDDLAKEPSGTAASRVVDLGDGRRGYAEAIWVDTMCLTCHGSSVSPEVEAELKSRYPQDAARGFAAGDFRGVFFAELDAL